MLQISYGYLKKSLKKQAYYKFLNNNRRKKLLIKKIRNKTTVTNFLRIQHKLHLFQQTLQYILIHETILVIAVAPLFYIPKMDRLNLQ